MGYKNSDSCIQKALEDERLFVLMTRDLVAPEVVCEWIKLSIRNQPPEKLHEALDCAIEMVRRNVEIVHKKNVATKLDKLAEKVKISSVGGDERKITITAGTREG